MATATAHHVSSVRRLSGFAAFFVTVFAVSAISQLLMFPGLNDWYPALNKSALTPAGQWFGIVWTVLYVLMALSAWKVWKVIGSMNNRPLAWWSIQLLAGAAWNAVFFGLHSIEGGLAMMFFALGSTLITVWQFGRVNKDAGLLMVPQVAWLTFATYLSFFIAAHN